MDLAIGPEPFRVAVVATAIAVLGVALWARNRRPRLAAVGVLAAASVLSGLPGSAVVLPVAVVVVYHAAGRACGRHRWTVPDVVVLIAPIPGLVLDPRTPAPGDALTVDVAAVWVFFFVTPWLAGLLRGRRSAVTTRLRANLELIARHEREREQQASTRERTRVAVELHDVLAHDVTLMVIQAAAARRVVEHDRAAALTALRQAEACGQEALAEMRRMIGVLRREGGALAGGAAPGVWDLDHLADRARAAGLPVTLAVSGQQRPLRPELGHLVFRLVQEALTNAVRHSTGSEVTIEVELGPDELEVCVEDDGTGHDAAALEGSGQGLVGMRERVLLYGGELEAGRTGAGGFRVSARIPTATGAEQQTRLASA